MASVTHQALLGLGGNAVAGRPGWYWPLSLVPDTPIWRDHSLFSDSAWLAAIQYAASTVPKSTTWQPQLSLPNYLFTRNRRLLAAMADGSSFTGNWLSSAGIVPAATPAFIGWQQALSVSRPTKQPLLAESYNGAAWLYAASIVSPAVTFLARTSGLDATHVNAYTALINGLVSDGVWTKLDFLHVYATQDATTALLNLVSTSYTATNVGAISFTVDRGFTGTEGSSTVVIDTTFNPTVGSPQYVRDSGHLSAWSVTNTSSANAIIGLARSSPSGSSYILPKQTSSGNAFFNINTSFSGIPGVANATTNAHFLASRTASNLVTGYKNGSSFTTDATASSALISASIRVPAWIINDVVTVSQYQIAQASAGAALNGTDATNLYTRLRTYMTAVGVP